MAQPSPCPRLCLRLPSRLTARMQRYLMFSAMEMIQSRLPNLCHAGFLDTIQSLIHHAICVCRAKSIVHLTQHCVFQPAIACRAQSSSYVM